MRKPERIATKGGDEETGKCFRVVPLARSHCYLTRTTGADARRARRETRKEKHCREKFRRMLFSLGSLHAYLMFNLSQLGILIIDMSRKLDGTFGMSPIRFLSCKGEIFDTRRSIESFWKWEDTTKRARMREKRLVILKLSMFSYRRTKENAS